MTVSDITAEQIEVGIDVMVAVISRTSDSETIAEARTRLVKSIYRAMLAARPQGQSLHTDPVTVEDVGNAWKVMIGTELHLVYSYDRKISALEEADRLRRALSPYMAAPASAEVTEWHDRRVSARRNRYAGLKAGHERRARDRRQDRQMLIEANHRTAEANCQMSAALTRITELERDNAKLTELYHARNNALTDALNERDEAERAHPVTDEPTDEDVRRAREAFHANPRALHMEYWKAALRADRASRPAGRPVTAEEMYAARFPEDAKRHPFATLSAGDREFWETQAAHLNASAAGFKAEPV